MTGRRQQGIAMVRACVDSQGGLACCTYKGGAMMIPKWRIMVEAFMMMEWWWQEYLIGLARVIRRKRAADSLRCGEDCVGKTPLLPHISHHHQQQHLPLEPPRFNKYLLATVCQKGLHPTVNKPTYGVKLVVFDDIGHLDQTLSFRIRDIFLVNPDTLY